MILLAILLAVSITASAGIARSERDALAGYPWVYLRGEHRLRPNEATLELVAVGDTSLARGIEPKTVFLLSQAWLRSADIAIANLECALSNRLPRPAADSAPNEPYRLVAPPSTVQALQMAGIDIASLANNHALDAGSAGLADTVHALKSAGMIAVGAGVSPESALEPQFYTAGGVKIAFLAFNAVASPDPEPDGWAVARWKREPALAAVRRASIAADAVVVSMHWGYEYERQASPMQVELAQALVAAGADLVIGSHPHAAQELLVQQRANGTSGVVALSLGNFAFDQEQEGARRGLALRAYFDRDGLRAAQVIPVRAGTNPVLDSTQTPLPEGNHSLPSWKEIAYVCSEETCMMRKLSGNPPSSPETGIFHYGSIDLTGDGRLEEIRLDHFRVSVFAQGKLDWQSPPEWQVLDLALGDADSDGRGDLVLALEKPDNKGVMQSHPFVIGYRGGYYGTVWGGSPVRDPVKEVELGDVNGDGQVELLVLELERSGTGRALTVWRWHGWGFSLDWRSTYAEFEELRLDGQAIWVKRLRN